MIFVSLDFRVHLNYRVVQKVLSFWLCNKFYYIIWNKTETKQFGTTNGLLLHGIFWTNVESCELRKLRHQKPHKSFRQPSLHSNQVFIEKEAASEPLLWITPSGKNAISKLHTKMLAKNYASNGIKNCDKIKNLYQTQKIRQNFLDNPIIANTLFLFGKNSNKAVYIQRNTWLIIFSTIKKLFTFRQRDAMTGLLHGKVSLITNVSSRVGLAGKLLKVSIQH